MASGFEKAGDVFDNFYGFFEEALSSKEIVPYHRDISSKSESESEYGWGGSDYDYFGGHHHHHKRSIDDIKKSSKVYSPIKISKEKSTSNLKKRSINSITPRKSMKITVTSEYDDSIADSTSSATSPVSVISNGSTKKPKKFKKPPKNSSEESEEYSLIDDIMGFRDDLDDSGDIDEDIDDSIEYYEDEMPSNRLPDGDMMEKTLEEYSDENTGGSIFDNFTNMFSSIGSFFSTFSDDKSRKPQSKYISTMMITTMKVGRRLSKLM